jgi:hypothetical protein
MVVREAPERGRTIWIVLVAVVFVAVLAAGATKAGQSTVGSVQHFFLFYGGVFALIALTSAVAAGLIATDRIFMSPGHRIVAQAVHRSVSLIAVAFLCTHIVLEILAHRANVIDAFLPFLNHVRTVYLGLGTLSSDLMVLIAVTGIMRRRFIETARPWTWRALHALAYLSWPFAILHGLTDGRHAKAYVDWSYGACLAAVALAMLIRFTAGLRPREVVRPPAPAPGVPDAGAWQFRAAAEMARAQFAGGMRALPAPPAALPPPRAALPAATMAGPPPRQYFQPPQRPMADESAQFGSGQRESGQWESGRRLYRPPPRSRAETEQRYRPPTPTVGPEETTGPIPRVETGAHRRSGTGPIPGAPYYRDDERR